MSDRDTTRDLLDRLRRHYINPDDDYPGGVFLTETGWNGADHHTRADALYVGFTAARSRLLIGHEVKVSRADWRRELAHPGKADPWADQCHAWYVVAPSVDIVAPDELPDGWGLLVVNPRSSTRLKTAVKAVTHEDRNPSWDAARSLMARLDTIQRTSVDAVRVEADRQAHVRYTDLVEQLRAERMDDLARLRLRALGELEDHLGFTIDHLGYGNRVDRPNAAQVAAALAVVRGSRLLPPDNYLRATQEKLETAVAQMAELRAAAEQLRGQLTDPEGTDT